MLIHRPSQQIQYESDLRADATELPSVNEYMICPVCGGTLKMLKPPCKLICFRCGYLASCSMD